MRREFSENHPELMDLECPDVVELNQDLKNLEILNRYFGGTTSVKKLFHLFAKKLTTFRLIDLGTGFGDHPRNIAQWTQGLGKKCTVIAVDRQRQTLQIAKNATSKRERIFFVQADVRKLPFKNQSAELVFCSLALHHFNESDAIKVLKESRRTAAHGMACMDLVRSRIAFVAVWLLTQFILINPMTRHDARISVKRAFTRKELKKIAENAGWNVFRHFKLPWFRQALVSSKSNV